MSADYDDAAQGVDLPPFPITPETKAALREAIGTTISFDDDGERILVGGDFTLNQLLDFYSGSDDTRKTLVGHGELIPGVDAPIYEMWDQHYSVTDVIAALLDALDDTHGRHDTTGHDVWWRRILRWVRA